jgi:hypothetical protein
LMALVASVCCAWLPIIGHGQSCTVSTSWRLPTAPIECVNVGIVVTATEKPGGPHPGKVQTWVTQNLQGVCGYSYIACNANQSASTTVQQAPPSVVIMPSYSSGRFTLTVSESQPTAAADPTPCSCSDQAPQGYKGVSISSPKPPLTEFFYGTC